MMRRTSRWPRDKGHSPHALRAYHEQLWGRPTLRQEAKTGLVLTLGFGIFCGYISAVSVALDGGSLIETAKPIGYFFAGTMLLSIALLKILFGMRLLPRSRATSRAGSEERPVGKPLPQRQRLLP